jgi:hypothetical protein
LSASWSEGTTERMDRMLSVVAVLRSDAASDFSCSDTIPEPALEAVAAGEGAVGLAELRRLELPTSNV